VEADPPAQCELPFGGPGPHCGFASLGSGSRGNGTVVAFGSVKLLVDCGFTLKQTRARLARLGLEPGELAAILVTHEHSDHIAGVGPLARRFGLPVYLSQGTLGARRSRLGDWADLDLRPFSGEHDFEIGGVGVSAVPVPHDAREPVQYVFEGAGRRIGVMTDLGHATPRLVDRYRALDGMLIESNHDLDMLRTGPYPVHLQRRVGGSHGHLNNAQALAFVTETVEWERTHLVVGHISEQNNCPRLLAGLYAPLAPRLPSLTLASQTRGTDWVDV
jgi:phosphoribosyl 1,2-cyclic phosphodiesterase